MDGVVIPVGTEKGTAEDLGDELADALAGVDFGVEVRDPEDAGLEVLDGSRVVVICTATQGDGELPTNSRDLFEALEEDEPDFTGLSFCVCGIGDSAYADFCEDGRIWSRTLIGLGATKVADRYETDGAGGGILAAAKPSCRMTGGTHSGQHTKPSNGIRGIRLFRHYHPPPTRLLESRSALAYGLAACYVYSRAVEVARFVGG